MPRWGIGWWPIKLCRDLSRETLFTSPLPLSTGYNTNFKHILNPTLQNRIAAVCRDCGFEPPVICTPEQLLEAESDEQDSDAD